VTLPARVDHGLARLAAGTFDDTRDPRTGQVPDQVITRLKGLPALLRTSGPLATLAFFAAKAGDRAPVARAYAAVGSALREQVAGEFGQMIPAEASFSAFVLALTAEHVTPDQLSRVTARLEAFALWLRRLAEAAEQEQERAKRRAAPAGGAGADGDTGSEPDPGSGGYADA
jgi:CRISPR-associated protein (Cas_Cmr5)